MTTWMVVALVVHHRSSVMQVIQTGVVRSYGSLRPMQTGEAAMPRDCGSWRLVETGQTGMVVEGVIVLVMEVGETGVWIELGRVLRRRVGNEGVLAEIEARTRTWTRVYVWSCGTGIRKHRLPRIPTLLVLVGGHFLLGVARQLVI